jgi:putative DNA primase/helicase
MTLLQNHTQQLDQSAIPSAIRRERGYWSATTLDEWAQRDGDMADYQRRIPGLAIPVYRLGNAKPYTLILRPDDPRVAPRDGKPRTIKYEWPAEKPLCIDLLPRYRDSLKDISIPIWFTEGAKKADAIAGLGQSIIPASLNGVWCWRNKNADGASIPLADFDDIALKGRRIVLAFDSDQAVNENVQKALKQFSAFLRKRGAIVGNLKLPHGDAKLGIDDAIAAGWTVEQLNAAIEWNTTGETLPDEGAAHKCTDLANARRLIAEHGDDLRYVAEWGWMAWDGSRWALDATAEHQRRAKDTAVNLYRAVADAPEHERKDLSRHAQRSESAGAIAAMIRLAESEKGVRAVPDDFDKQLMTLTCTNGALDLTTGELLPHDRDELCTKMTDIIFDKNAKAPTWLTFMDRIFGGDQDLIAWLQRAIGYTLTGRTDAQCMFICYGKGANGKSVFIDVIRALLGDYARNADASTFMVQQSDRIRSDVARLAGARFVATVELDEGRRLSEALVKQVSSGDRMTARFLNKNDFEFTPRFKLWMATNHKPTVKGTDFAIWRRIKLIPFNVTIPEDERDVNLTEKLLGELPGILAWAIRGCVDYQQKGLKDEPPAIKNATTAYRNSMDILGQFLDECTVSGQRCEVSAGTIYQAYVRWSEGGKEKPITQTRFGEQMIERGIDRIRRRNGFYYLGIELADNSSGPQSDEGLFSQECDPCDPCEPKNGVSTREEITKEIPPKVDHTDHTDHTFADSAVRAVPYRPNVNQHRELRQQEEAELEAIRLADEELF